MTSARSTRAANLRLRPRLRLDEDAEGEGGMLFDTQTAMICACNPTAWTLVSAMRKGSDIDRLTGLIAEAFEVDRPVARKDVLALVKQLRSLDLLEPD